MTAKPIPSSGWTFSTSAIPDGVVCGTIGNFIMVSLVSDEFTVQWCAIGNPNDWPTPLTDDARAKQAGSEKLNPEFGIVTGITGSEFYGYVFQQRAITRFTYIGGDIVFNVNTFERTRGCIDYNRFTRSGDTVFYESQVGRHSLLNNQVSDIGYGRTDDTYPPTYSGDQSTVAVNDAIQTVFFEDGRLAYNYKTDQWTRTPILTSRNYYNLDSEDGVIGQVVFITSPRRVALQDSDGGIAATTILETGDTDINQGGRASIDGVRPLINGGTVSVRVGVRDSISDSVAYATGTSVNSRTGMANFRNADNRPEGRYQRLRCQVTGGFTTALGADIEFSPSGRI
jgi:hypothetical protein